MSNNGPAPPPSPEQARCAIRELWRLDAERRLFSGADDSFVAAALDGRRRQLEAVVGRWLAAQAAD
jgi:hypothetical protein